MALRIGTRASALAMTQAGTVAEMLGADLVPIVSEGDTSTASLATLGGTGVFAKALRDALLRGDVDAVVHSFKDLPTAAEPGLVIAAVPPRVDARDALCARDGMTLDELPEGARVGTGSPRRRAQLAMRRPDLDLVDIRGNIDTRLGRVGHDDPERALDAVILAAAGLSRIGRLDAVTEMFDLDRWPTAPAQGALAVEVRAGDEHVVRRIDHPESRAAADAERGVLARLEAGCAAPIAAMSFVDDGLLFLTARVYRPDGGEMIDSSRAMPLDADAPAELATLVGVDLIERGAARIAPLDPSTPAEADTPSPRRNP